MPILVTFIAFWSTRGGGGIQTFWAWDVLEMAFIGLQKGPLFQTFEKLPTQRGGGRGRSPNSMAKNRGVSMSSVVITLRLLDQNVFGGLPFRNQ